MCSLMSRPVWEGAYTGEYTVWFGGSYQENWTEDYTLSIDYHDRRGVTAAWSEGRWIPVGGDRVLSELLREPHCPALFQNYFQAAASVYAAARSCAESRVPLTALPERFYDAANPLAAPELMRLLMDDCGFSLQDAYQLTGRCCGDLRATGVELSQMYGIQPRTAHVISILRSCGGTLLVAHDAWDERFRRPLGAVREGESVTLSIRIVSGRAERAFLLLCGDEGTEEVPMEPSAGGFTVTLNAPEQAAALWYRFRIETPDSAHWLCPDGSGHLGRLYGYEAEGFRLTVYKKDFETPAWFRRSVMYQVFPDRFAFSNDGTAERGIAYHTSLGQTPELHRSLDEPLRWQPRPFEQSYSPDDFYGGTLRGIEQKLPYLRELGVGVLYLNPIVEARSNHRYDTSDYRRVDPILGSNEDFAHLCEMAEKMGIRIMLDGVFSHTGADSIYFNRYNHYPSHGACQGQDSPYYSWYEFHSFPNDYRSWWGFADLPEVEETNPAWQEQIVTGRDSVVKTWLRRGAAGWRLDVADELPDGVLSLIRKAAKEEKPDAPILGEVWEDPVIKESYGTRRNYALGYSLDSVMNYPFRAAVLDFLHWRCDAYSLRDFLRSQQMNYPKPLYYSLMNLLGSHDMDRIRSALATDTVIRDLPREEQLRLSFPQERLDKAIELEKLCAAIQFSVPGVPSIYYGDEQGMCGVCDPFNRAPFRLGERQLHDCYANLAAKRNAAPALSTGHARFMAASPDVLLILRWIEGGKDVFGLPAENGAYLTVVNRGESIALYSADCSAADKGFVSGSIGPCSAEVLKL